MKTTNYYNTFIEVAEDCPVKFGEVPPHNHGKTTAANLQYEMLKNHPYQYTSDDILFRVFAIKHDIDERDYKQEREKFFSKGQPCFRSSPLTKRYGWGVHSDGEGKIAIYPMDSTKYHELLKDKNIGKVKAMRTKKSSHH